MKLRELQIQGFKSFDRKCGATIKIGDATVLLGANGSGKSNLISFLHMLQSIAENRFTQFVNKYGANRLLFYGIKETQDCLCRLKFHDKGKEILYMEQMSFKVPDGLYLGIDNPTKDEFREYLQSRLNHDDIYCFLSQIRIYQFNDTSESSKIRGRCYVDDAMALHHDAGNLASVLKMLKEHESYRKYYDRIVLYIRGVMPQFGDFALDPLPGNKEYVRLNWRDSSGSEYLFDPHHISDGALRFMALATALLQPAELMPRMIVLDEPELGLHPMAIQELAAMVKMASRKAQVLLATQSQRLVDEFSADDVVIVERDDNVRGSVFMKLDSGALADWLARYCLSELWEKNVLGGQP